MRDITLEDTIYIDFSTRAFATGVPTVLAGTPVLSVLEENNATPITAGVSVSVDRASVVGLNMATIVATAANGYENGKGYSVYISTGTVGGVSVVGEKVGEFTIGASAAAVDLANGTDGLGVISTNVISTFLVADLAKDGTILQSTTIATLASQTSFTLAAGSADDNAYNNCTIIIEDASTAVQRAVGLVSGYTGSSKTITLKYDPAIFTMATTDKIFILTDNSLKSSLANRQIGVEADGSLTDKAGFSLSTAGILAIWHQALSAVATAGTVGKLLKDEITSARMATLTDWIDGGRLDSLLDAIPTTAMRGTDSALTDKAGFSLSATGADLILKSAIFALAIADAVWDEALSGHNTGGTAGKALKNAADFVITDGTAQAGAATSITLAAGESATNNIFNFTRIIIISGTGAGQNRVAVGYNGTTKVLSVSRAWDTNPDATSVYDIVPAETHVATQVPGYVGGAVWIGPVANTNTTSYVDGTADNPVSTIAAAKTIADNLGLMLFHLLPTVSVTLAESFDGYEFIGEGYTVALGGQSVSGTLFMNATITGNDDGTNTVATGYNNCTMGSSTLGLHEMHNCHLGGDLVIAEAGAYIYDDCSSNIAGATTPSFDYGALLNASDIRFTRYSGGMEIKNMGQGTGTYNLSKEGDGHIVFASSCTGGVIELRGHNELTNNGSGLTITDVANYEHNAIIDTIATDAARLTAARAGALTDLIDGGRLDLLIDAIKAVTDQQGATILEFTVDTVTNTHTPTVTEFQADDITEATADHYNGRLVLFTSGVLSGQMTDITDYEAVGGIGQFTVTGMTEAPSNNDTGIII